MSDQVGNPEDRFPRVAAHMTIAVVMCDVKHEINLPTIAAEEN